ncbi:MAG TPA: translation initiation factor IF-2 [Candidatus Margulisiibacteriota bacterium]|nr:translation initiation factor IF-2 [Candidatus Margulisiibacteriota bacterium]
MVRKRIHELSREWNVEAKDLLAKLEKLGIHGKRSQSSLTDDEVERLRVEFGADEKPSVTVGDERVLEGIEGETVVERRVRTNVIRRRTTRIEPVPSQETLPQQPSEPLPLATEAFESFAAPESLPEPLPAALSEEAVTIPPPAAAPPETPPTPVVRVTQAPAAAPAEPAPSPTTVEPLRGPRVLGRIDLKKTEPVPPARREAAEVARERARREVGGVPPLPETEEGKPKKKKRKVISKPEFQELTEQERRRAKLPRKKKALPGKEQKKTEITTPRASKRIVRIAEVITVGELAKAMGVKAGEIIKKLMDSGMMATINQALDIDTATLIAADFDYNVENVAFDAESMLEVEHEAQADESVEARPPVVTIMGHVDHGKTSLLDAIRQTNVTAQEAGGITQHIGAYSVDVHGRKVTFLDTPGHEAFTAMRARGAKVTDIVVLVVAADDGVMPQTAEAINHARAASVPILVAINKIDKPEANIEKIKQGLTDYGLVAEDWGGDTICVPVSAKTKEGIPQLLEMLLLQADILDLKANSDKLARGTIVEAKLDRGRGPVATVLVQEGTLKVGAPFVCGGNYGRVRAMVDDKGRKVETAGPSMPVEILGLQGVPDAGSPFVAVGDEATARQVAEHRRGKQREANLVKTAKVSLEDLYQQIQAGDVKELRVVIKADVQGSVEALAEALTRLSTEEVRLNVIHASVGGITESDALLASASNAVVIGFNVRPEAKASEIAEREGVDVRLYTVIYDALNEIRDAMEGLLEPTVREKTVGRAEVRQVFTVPSFGAVAGSFVVDGRITRNASVRLVRDHVVVYTGKVASLRRFKEDAREVQSGYECGIGLENYQDVKAGDVVEAFEVERVARRLGPTTSRSTGAERRV